MFATIRIENNNKLQNTHINIHTRLKSTDFRKMKEFRRYSGGTYVFKFQMARILTLENRLKY